MSTLNTLTARRLDTLTARRLVTFWGMFLITGAAHAADPKIDSVTLTCNNDLTLSVTVKATDDDSDLAKIKATTQRYDSESDCMEEKGTPVQVVVIDEAYAPSGEETAQSGNVTCIEGKHYFVEAEAQDDDDNVVNKSSACCRCRVSAVCCLPNDSGCSPDEDPTEVDCDAAGGMFHLGTTCASGICSEIPTVSEWGLIILTLLGMTAGTIMLGRRRTATPAW